MNAQKCRHCGERIVLTNYLAWGPTWEHQLEGNVDQRTWRICEGATVAEPEETSA
jgi:hypothetical protein